MNKHGAMQTFRGHTVFPLNPHPRSIDIRDIAHALSNLCRFGGHTTQFYSVAQHCVWGSWFTSREDALPFLLHDAAEAYLVDLPRPIKYSPGFEAYREAEERLYKVIAGVFKIPDHKTPGVELVDRRMLFTEKRDMLVKAENPWTINGMPEEEPFEGLIIAWGPDEAERNFLDRYCELTGIERRISRCS